MSAEIEQLNTLAIDNYIVVIVAIGATILVILISLLITVNFGGDRRL